MAIDRGGSSQPNAQAVQANKQAISNSKAVAAASPSQSASGADALAAARAAGAKMGASSQVTDIKPNGQASTMSGADKLSNDAKVVMDAKTNQTASNDNQQSGRFAAALAQAKQNGQNAPAQSKDNSMSM